MTKKQVEESAVRAMLRPIITKLEDDLVMERRMVADLTKRHADADKKIAQLEAFIEDQRREEFSAGNLLVESNQRARDATTVMLCAVNLVYQMGSMLQKAVDARE